MISGTRNVKETCHRTSSHDTEANPTAQNQLCKMPIEVIVLIYRDLDSIKEVLNLASTCHLLSSIWKLDTYEILYKILSRQLLSYDMAKKLAKTQLIHLAFHTISSMQRARNRQSKAIDTLLGSKPVTGYFLDKEKQELWFYTLEIQSIMDQQFQEGKPWSYMVTYYVARLCILACFFSKTRTTVEMLLNRLGEKHLAGIEQIVRLLWNRKIFMFKLKCERDIGGVGASDMEETPREEWQEVLDMVSRACSKAAKIDT